MRYGIAIVATLGMMVVGCSDIDDNTLETVERLEQEGHEVTWLEAPTEESVTEGNGCPGQWTDPSQVAIKCGLPSVLATKTFNGIECQQCKVPKCGGPWTSIATPILCAPGFDLTLNNDGTCQRCVESDAVVCARGGCSGQICYDASQPEPITTCEFLPEYACYDGANCGPFGPGGSCAWEDTPELAACIENAQSNGF